MPGPNIVYFDLETQKSAAEVGGWHNKRAMKIALGVTYSTARGTYEIYREDDVYALLQELQRGRMDGIAAEIAEEIVVLLEHGDGATVAGQKVAEHHSRGAAAYYAASGDNIFSRHILVESS